LDPDTVGSVGRFLLLTEAGELIINGGPEGDDLLEGNAGNDILIGDGGSDTATYANDPGPVNISLGNIFNPGFGYGFDGYGNFDTLISIENLIGSNFADTLNGDDKANSIWGGTGNDTISGLGGNDTLYGEAGDDRITAGDGDDYIVGGKGGDYIDGGNGIDTTSYLQSDFGVVVDVGIIDVNLLGISLYTQGNGYSGDARGDTLINVENIEGSLFVDQLWGTNGANKIEGFAGDDQIFGRGGDDLLYGGNGNDVIRAGDGNDNVYGGDGRDNLFGDAGDDFIYGGDGFDELTGGDGNDRIFGEDGTDRLFGGNDNDSIYGNDGVDSLDGGSGDDLLSGDEGNDILKGGVGIDTLKGGLGNDWIEGGFGADNLYGGNGKDLFVFSKDPITGGRVSGFTPGSTSGSSNTIFIGETNGIPYISPGTIDTIYDFKNSGQWWEFGSNIDQIGLRDGLRYQDLIFYGVSSVQGDSTANSTIIGYYGRNESFAPLVEVIGLTPDKFKSADFVLV
jgi:Ca2+-binding RTX toxin-like protein